MAFSCSKRKLYDQINYWNFIWFYANLSKLLIFITDNQSLDESKVRRYGAVRRKSTLLLHVAYSALHTTPCHATRYVAHSLFYAYIYFVIISIILISWRPFAHIWNGFYLSDSTSNNVARTVLLGTNLDNNKMGLWSLSQKTNIPVYALSGLIHSSGTFFSVESRWYLLYASSDHATYLVPYCMLTWLKCFWCSQPKMYTHKYANTDKVIH